MATNNQMNQFSGAAVLGGGESTQVDKEPVGEADLHAVDALHVVGHSGPRPLSEFLTLAIQELKAHE
jgi:hypothetical protein